MESTSAPQSRQRRQAPYGRACKTCSRAKCKCIYLGDAANCERCHRLKKDCRPSTSVRKLNAKKTPRCKRNDLEEKIEDLVSLLRSQAIEKQGNQAAPATIDHNPSLDLDNLLLPHESGSSSPTDVVIETTTGFAHFAPHSPITKPPHSSVSVSPSPITNYISIYEIPNATAEEQLGMFRRVFLPLFAFVHIPAMMSASDFRHQKPFLWLVIMSFTTKSVAEQLAMDNTIRQIVSQQVVAQHEKSLDILLGIICYLAWSHYHKKEKSSLVVWTQLAVALVFELGIHRAPQGDMGRFCSNTVWLPTRHSRLQVRSMDERRAILGAFLVSSMVWIALRKMEPLRWTSYMDNCVRVLSEESETELDIFLATQAKCHVIMNQMTSSLADWAVEGEGSKATPTYLVQAMQTQLQNIRQSLPDEIQSNKIVLLYIYGTDIFIKEALLNRLKIKDQTGLSGLKRLEGLDSILTAIEQWWEVFYEVPVAEWIGITYSIFAQFGHCIMLLFKLTILDEPGWDRDEVKKRVDMLDMLERVAQRFEVLTGFRGRVAAADIEDAGLFFKAARLIRGLKAMFLSEMAPTRLQTDAQSGGNLDTAGSIGGLSVPDDIIMDLVDDPWLTDIFVSWWEV